VCAGNVPGLSRPFKEPVHTRYISGELADGSGVKWQLV
jgi:hypothetical protein